MLVSSNLKKIKFQSNISLPKDKKNHLDKDSIVKIDIIYKISRENILFKVGSVDKDKIDLYKKKFNSI